MPDEYLILKYNEAEVSAGPVLSSPHEGGSTVGKLCVSLLQVSLLFTRSWKSNHCERREPKGTLLNSVCSKSWEACYLPYAIYIIMKPQSKVKGYT